MKEYEFTGKAMGTTFVISIVSQTPEAAEYLASAAIQEIQGYEAQFSRFLLTSELSQLNAARDLVVSRRFMDVALEAFNLYESTSGIFNPLVQISRLGYNTDYDTIGSQEVITSNLYNINFTETQFDKKTSRIILQPGQQLDFGGILKGYASEQIAKHIMAASTQVSGVIINIGGDLHSCGVDENGEEFIISIYNPITGESEISIPIFNQGLATSGTYKRVWDHDGATVHHILDASGGSNPNSHIISASIVHNSGSRAEGYAKVFLSCDTEIAVQMLPTNTYTYVLIKDDGTTITNFV